MLFHLDLGVLPKNQWNSRQILQQYLPALNNIMPFLQAVPLTDALINLNPAFSVRLNQLGIADIQADERAFFNSDQGYSREVQLCLQNKAVIWARSICQHDAQQWQNGMQCGTRPLGQYLYRFNIQRSAFEFACLTVEHPCNPSNELVLARRSCFMLHAKPLLLTETFLPEIMTFYH